MLLFQISKYKAYSALLATLSGLLIWGMSGCEQASQTTTKPTPSQVLVTLANQNAQPSMADAALTAAELKNKVRLLSESPSDQSLAEARSAWKTAYLAWLQAAPMRMGPGDHLDRLLGKWPVNAMVLDAAVSSAELRHLLKNVDMRGYAAAEHLLFAPKDIAAFKDSQAITHLLDVTDQIALLTAEANTQWQQGYTIQFASAGDGKPFLIPADALSMVIRQALNVTERTLWDRIGMPSGFFESPAKPQSLEAWESGMTIPALKAIARSLRQTLLADGEDANICNLVATQDGLVEDKDPALASAIARQLDQIDKAIANLGDPDQDWQTQLKRDPKKLKPLYKQFQTLQDQLIEAALVLELDVHRPTDMTALVQTQ